MRSAPTTSSRSADAYRNVVVTYRNSAPVLISDVADVVDGLENAHVAGWYQGKPAVIIDVQRQPGANVVRDGRAPARRARQAESRSCRPA